MTREKNDWKKQRVDTTPKKLMFKSILFYFEQTHKNGLIAGILHFCLILILSRFTAWEFSANLIPLCLAKCPSNVNWIWFIKISLLTHLGIKLIPLLNSFLQIKYLVQLFSHNFSNVVVVNSATAQAEKWIRKGNKTE